MRELSLMLNLEPISVNHSHGFGKGYKYKLPKTNKFLIKLKGELDQFKEELDEFYQNFDRYKHVIHCGYYFYSPTLTTKGTSKEPTKISKHSKDLDNCIKILQDGIFKYIKIDDTFVTRIEAEKRRSKSSKWSIIVQISIRPLFLLH